MNSGVKLVAGGEDQVIESVQKLIDQGTEVLVCGTCLDFYGLKEQLQVGDVSNMYDILERMRDAAKVITLVNLKRRALIRLEQAGALGFLNRTVAEQAARKGAP